MKLVWSPQALDDLVSIKEFIHLQNPRAAIETVKTIAIFVEKQLPQFPHAGREGRVKGTRELVIPQQPFIIPYRVTKQNIEIIRIYHTSRRWPDGF